MPPKNAYNNQYHTLHVKKMGVFVSFNEQGGHKISVMHSCLGITVLPGGIILIHD